MSVTVLVPWLIGRSILRGTWLYPYDDRIFEIDPVEGWTADSEARNEVAKYFLPDYLGGLIIVGLLLAATLLLRTWRRRSSSVAVGVAMLILCGLATPIARDSWQAAEEETVAVLETTSFPISERMRSHLGKTCWSDELFFGDRAWKAAIVGNNCNVLLTYRGWKEAGRQVLLPAGVERMSSLTAFTSTGGGPGDTSVVVRVAFNRHDTNVKRMSGYDLSTGRLLWSKDYLWSDDEEDHDWWPTWGTVDDELLLIDGILRIKMFKPLTQGPDERKMVANNYRVSGIDVRTGEVAWVAECPKKYYTIDISNTDEVSTMRCRQIPESRTSRFVTHEYTYTNSGDIERSS